MLKIRHVAVGSSMNEAANLAVNDTRFEAKIAAADAVSDNTRKIVLVSDIHVGGLHVAPKRVRRLVKTINAQNPDIILIPGDFINGHDSQSERSARKNAQIDQGLAALGSLSAPAYATIGNHDRWYGASYVERRLTAAGITVLENAGARHNRFCVVGIADDLTGVPNAFGYTACEPGDIVLAMMHSPDSQHLLKPHTALAVAGHTHGGQVNLPVFGRVQTATDCGKPCAYGFINTAPQMFVTSGVGTSILPLRFRSPPEIVVITLHTKKGEIK